MKGKEVVLSILFFFLGIFLASSYFFFLALPAREQVFKEQAETLGQKVSQLGKRLEQANRNLKALNIEIARLTTETPEAEKTEEDTAKKTSSTSFTKHIGIIKKA